MTHEKNMHSWWGIERGVFVRRWLVLALLWGGVLGFMQWLPLSLLGGLEQSPLFQVQAFVPEMQSLLATSVWPWGGNAAAWAVLALGGVACTGACVADWQEHVLPDQFTLGGGVVTGLASLLVWGWEHAVLGALFGYAFLWGLQRVLRRKQQGTEQLGCGDVKFMILLGTMVGPLGLLPVLGIACVLVMPLFKIRKAPFVPFGPALALASLITLALGLRWPMV